MSDPSDLFGPIDALPGARLPERLEHGVGEDAFGALRSASAAWLREGGDGDAFGRALVGLEPLLGRSYLLGQPNLAGMGVAPWDLARSVGSEAVANPIGRARRMVGPGMLDDLLAEDDDESETAEDPEAIARGADLLEAIQTLDAAARDLPDGAPDAVYDHVQSLRADLADRLRRERRHAPALDRALRGHDLGKGDTVRALRQPPAPRGGDAPGGPEVIRARPTSRLVDEAPETVVAQDQPWPQPMGPSPEMAPSPGRERKKPAPSADLGQLARMVSAETGTPVAELLAEALKGKAPKPRKDKGAAGAAPAGHVSIEHVHIDGLVGTDPGIAQVLQSALQVLPDALERALADRGGAAALEDRSARVDLTLGLSATDAPATVARRIADRIAREGARRVGALHLGVDVSGPARPRETPRSLLTRLAVEDSEGIASALAGERKTLDGALRDRLARFFGDDFKDVLVFAGPMAGALARSLSAEAVTHGNMVFFDPKHFRLDTPKGEALIAHELAHTRQDDDRDDRVKEAEALRTEAAYLSWISPGGANFVEEQPLDPTAPSAAGGAVSGMFAAKEDRHLEGSAGPRADQAEHEKRLEQVLGRVRELLSDDVWDETNRYGRVSALRRLRLW